ncbi:MAG: hypothetical protein PHG25_00350 [Candidatus Pacebacteria bacterium]|nr:hypothetical protein [Candidatus Paceibacterota bacterium]
MEMFIKCSGRIKVHSLGDQCNIDVPMSVRQEWVGLVLPIAGIASGGHTVTIIDGKKVKCEPSYAVLQSVALFELKKKSEKAFDWFREHGYPKSVEACFIFMLHTAAPVGEIKQI